MIERMQARGWEVAVTARAFAQTVELPELHGLTHTVIGRHGGRSLAGKARAAGGRVAAMVRFGRRGRFDAALAHGSTDLPMACAALRIPNTTMFDYEFATLQHSLNCRLAWRVLVPDAIPLARLRRLGARPAKLVRYPGLKEEYSLADVRLDPAVPAALGSTGRPWASCCARRRTSPSITGSRTRSSTRCSSTSAPRRRPAVVLPRTPAQADRLGPWSCPRWSCPSTRWTAPAWSPAPTWW